MTALLEPTEAMIEACARALCRVTRVNPDAAGLDDNPRWYGWKKFASAAYLAMRSSAPQEPDGLPADGVLTEGTGTTACPICGKATPHWHDPDDKSDALARWLREISLKREADEIAAKAAQEPDDDAEWLRTLATEADELDRQYVALSSRDARRIADRLRQEKK